MHKNYIQYSSILKNSLDNFLVLVKVLEKLSKNTANSKTKIKSYQLFTAATKLVLLLHCK